MIRVYSKVEADLLLHAVNRLSDFIDDCRVDISSPRESLQLAAIDVAAATSYRPHIHLLQPRPPTVTQEAWIVITGVIEVSYYDIDGTFLEMVTIEPGDCSITFQGGHGYKIVRGPARVYETKTGPYLGQAADKQFIK